VGFFGLSMVCDGSAALGGRFAKVLANWRAIGEELGEQ
jgi:hypothetical protein